MLIGYACAVNHLYSLALLILSTQFVSFCFLLSKFVFAVCRLFNNTLLIVVSFASIRCIIRPDSVVVFVFFKL